MALEPSLMVSFPSGFFEKANMNLNFEKFKVLVGIFRVRRGFDLDRANAVNQVLSLHTYTVSMSTHLLLLNQYMDVWIGGHEDHGEGLPVGHSDLVSLTLPHVQIFQNLHCVRQLVRTRPHLRDRVLGELQELTRLRTTFACPPVSPLLPCG